MHDERVQCLQTVELMSDMNTPGLISKLQEEDTLGRRERERVKKKVSKEHQDLNCI